jgi:phage terminase Nu1 subunit (DNA packaging protein)
MALVNKAQLADLLGYAERSLTDWQDEGMPVARRADLRGQANEYNTAEVVAWLLTRAERKARAESPREELYRSQVRLNTLKIDEAEKRLVDAKEVEQEFSRLVIAARTRLLQLPGLLAQDLQEALPAAWRNHIDKAIRNALAELSEGARVGTTSEGPQE